MVDLVVVGAWGGGGLGASGERQREREGEIKMKRGITGLGFFF